MAFKKTPRVCAEIPEFVDLDPSLEPEDAFHVREGVAIGLEVPEAEELVVQTTDKDVIE